MSAAIIPFPGVSRSRWSGFDEYVFRHYVSTGMSTRDAAALVESLIEDERASEALPKEDRLLFLARRCLRRLRPREESV